jgi:hypothetical protein
VHADLHCIGLVPDGRCGAARRTPTVARNSDRPPHQKKLSFAFTSAPCVISAAAISVFPLCAAQWSGVYLRPIALTHTAARARRLVRSVRGWVCVGVRVRAREGAAMLARLRW